MVCGLKLCRSKPDLREYTTMSVSCSTFKPKHAPALMLDEDKDTYWQSNNMGRRGKNTINIQLAKIVNIEYVVVCVNYAIDRSFTPEKISVHVGFDESGVQEIGILQVQKSTGWAMYKLPSFKYKFIQLRVESNYSYGQDSRVRGVKLFRRCETDEFSRQYRL